jgi:hypothetical protein
MGLTHYEMVDTPLSCRTFCATWQLASHCSRVFVCGVRGSGAAQIALAIEGASEKRTTRR